MRHSFVAAATALLDSNPNTALVLADIGVSQFRQTGAIERHPERVINVGIREQLMIGVAAGFALEGYRPIAHSYTPFLIERPFEQIKLDFAHQGVDGLLVSLGASYDATSEGRTHQAPEDVMLMASLPGWSVVVPGHPDEVEVLLQRAVAAPSASTYLRLAAESNTDPYITPAGEFTTVRKGSPEATLIIAVGPTLDRTLQATRDLDATVLYASTVRPFDRAGTADSVGSGDVVLIEPYLEGTSSSEVSAALQNVRHRLLAIGVQNEEHRRYGSLAQHTRAHGLDATGISLQIARFLAHSA